MPYNDAGEPYFDLSLSTDKVKFIGENSFRHFAKTEGRNDINLMGK